MGHKVLTKEESNQMMRRINLCLNSPGGLEMMDLLKIMWADPNPLNDQTQITGYNIGLAEAYKQLVIWKEDGENYGN